MTKIFTSDLHFDHKNICKYTDRHKVTSTEEHTEWLINLWNSQVNNEDQIYHLGDFSFGKKYEDIKRVVQQLKGQKFFFKGNHDKKENLEKLKQENLIQAWYDYKEFDIQGTPIAMFHFPIACWHRQGYGAWHLHGHSHGSYHAEGKILDVGLDNAYNLYGEHKFFTEEMLATYMQTKQVKVYDAHSER